MSGPTNDHDLTNALNRRAEDFARLGGHDLDLSQVVSRAGEIQRGRRMRASMMMAAVVLAVAVPVGIVALNNNQSSKTPHQLATNSPTPTPTADPGPLGLDGLKLGAVPAIGYQVGSKLYVGKNELPATAESASFPVRIDGGFLLPGANDSVTFLGDDGMTIDQTWSYVGGFAVSPGGNVGAFVEPDGTVIAIQDGGSRYFEVGKAPAVSGDASWTVAAVTGENCSGRSQEPGCTIYLNDQGTSQVVAKIQPHRDSVLVYPQFQRLADVEDQGWAAGITSVSDTGSCSQVVDQVGDPVWKTCDYAFKSFSPNGKFLLAGPAYGDGAGDGSLAVIYPGLKATNPASVILDLKTTDGVAIFQTTWENNSHVLAVVFKGDEWAVVRIGLDGSRELALPVVKGTGDFVSPYTLG